MKSELVAVALKKSSGVACSGGTVAVSVTSMSHELIQPWLSIAGMVVGLILSGVLIVGHVLEIRRKSRAEARDVEKHLRDMEAGQPSLKNCSARKD